ncbi:MAG: 4-phospho-D-threonate 3-dehydrogenase / 4-phospho-D-erythronate 3-dehydrogenase [Acetobacterium sp.]|jgi:4-hydroxythreonine-4-phosphate dehydrogenase|uniref:4-hydroxythreonine-4-phosphate dehydrogenase PdxA n=1 Tax=Acetobacterium sp. K1/6 TaxID=3055467 RepID=UPI0029E0A633|nr:4-hydroxythreonine-4-phosphate dehydrogenase PdxA [Acetobacterium sp. K1/6]MDK2941772.1 4-phospho-D-threonate 3-dehydrogenase / 4-phospho-D-erythronate 3-dehydrogenase [Acetobacterium sp.]MDZ5723736.1 4-hydroxythreonine-4-phosphate dehydrogenase PdxA [Acetobacterium sp. K1/6]
MTKPILAIPMGDAAGIGPEITVKAMADDRVSNMARLVIVGDKKVLKEALAFSDVTLLINCINDPQDGNFSPGVLNLIDLDNIYLNKLKMGAVQAMTGKAAYEYIEVATRLCLDKKTDVLTTTAINKESLKAAKVPYIGHTEMVGALTQTKNPLTMFQVHNLRVFFLSRHVSLQQACKLVTRENIEAFIDQSVAALKTLGVKNPRIAVAGLNPHSGEHGLFGWEEVEGVMPAVVEARNRGINVDGPIGADSVFYLALSGKYDAVLSLYHDQGHIATKMVDFEKTISITLGMPFLRTSVDHGTALDIAGKGIASPVSLIEAIRLGVEYAPLFNQRW